MSRLIWFVAGAATVAGAVVLNPSPAQHHARIKAAVAERSPLAALLRLGDLAAFVSHYHSVGVASYTTADDKLLSVGALGMVWVMDRKGTGSD